MKTKKLIRKLNRLKKQQDKLLIEHGDELKQTYWGGYELGYVKGKIHEIEDILDELDVDVSDEWRKIAISVVEEQLKNTNQKQ